ncbi:MAG: hypothetical protein BMS9Abin07_2015 [Acidimicrobiia bacterium]|nr:MAG: hypothetical protein BMS9Abin07_2015 [Acidimicrobiia bacterium]
MWWIVAAAFVALYAVLAVVVRVAPDNGVDRAVLDWVAGRELSFLDGTTAWISWFTDLRPRLVLAVVGVIGIALTGHYRLAAATALAVGITALPINALDLLGGTVADRIRPNGSTILAYPSGHTLGTLIQCGFGIYIVLRLGLHRWLLMPLVALLALPIVVVGPARILREEHWPTDVVGAYLLGVASVIALVLVMEIGRRWLAQRALFKDSLRPWLAPSSAPSR